MLRTCERRLFRAMLLLMAFAMSGFDARAEWQDRTLDLGGWLDTDTGLVWSQDSITLIGASATWSGAFGYANYYQSVTGNPAWRVPTVTELAEVGAKLDPQFPVPFHYVDEWGNSAYGRTYWSSDTKGKNSAYVLRTWTQSIELFYKESIISAIAVYSTSPPPPPTKPGKGGH